MKTLTNRIMEVVCFNDVAFIVCWQLSTWFSLSVQSSLLSASAWSFTYSFDKGFL